MERPYSYIAISTNDFIEDLVLTLLMEPDVCSRQTSVMVHLICVVQYQLTSNISLPIKVRLKIQKSGVHYSYYGKCASLLLETALRPPQTLLAKILDT